jgi:hypothetical protein
MTDLYGPELLNTHTGARPAIDNRPIQDSCANYRIFGGWPAGTTADRAAGSGIARAVRQAIPIAFRTKVAGGAILDYSMNRSSG